MPSTKPPYPAEFRQQLVELVRAGRTPAELSREFGPSAQSIINWVAADSAPSLNVGKPRSAAAPRAQQCRTRRARTAAPGEPPAQDGARHPGKGYGLVRGEGRQDLHRVFKLVSANQADANALPVRAMCRVLGVSASGYYAWRDRPPSARAVQDAALTEQLRILHTESDATYGAPRLCQALRQGDTPIGCKRVARLMKVAQLCGVSRRRAYTVTTQRDKASQAAPDFVSREFVADGPNQLWVADMTYIPTWSGFLYLATVLDAWSRRVVGWAFGEHMTADLVISAMDMALAKRRPRSVIHHSDQGSQYTSLAFGKRCREMGVQPSMGSVGDAYDNAMAESFFATLECELIERRSWQTKAQARMAVFRYIEAWYNPRRLHSSLGYRSPVQSSATTQS